MLTATDNSTDNSNYINVLFEAYALQVTQIVIKLLAFRGNLRCKTNEDLKLPM